MFAHQTTLDTLELKKDKSTNYASKPNIFNTVSLHSIKLDQDQIINNYASKLRNAFIVSDLNTCRKILFNNFKLKNCMFVATNIVKSSDKEKWLHSDYGIAFDGGGLWKLVKTLLGML